MGFAIALLKDDFSAAASSPMWGASGLDGSATLAQTGGQAVVTLPSSVAGTHQGYWRTGGRYDLTGDGIYWNIQTMVSTSVAATAGFYLLTSDLTQQVYWRQLSGTLTARSLVAGVDSSLYSVAWNASTHKYLRIRESAGTIYWDSSTNGTSWTNRASVANPFAVTDLVVHFAAACGNVASPGSLKLDDVNLVLPAPSATWRYTTADWSISNRLRPITLASSGSKEGVIVTADAMDSSEVLSGNLRYFAGPLGSVSGGYLALTEYASLALAQASAFSIPVDDRVDLPFMVDARYMRLYHRSTDASSHNLYEFVPRRIVQADDIEAEKIRTMHLGAGVVTADKIFVLTLGAITANIGKLNIDTTGYLYQGTGTGDSPTTGLKIFNSGGIGKLSTYNAGVEQVTFGTDGKLYAGGGNVRLDATSLAFSTASEFVAWYASAYTTKIGRILSSDTTGVAGLTASGYGSTTNTAGLMNIEATCNNATQAAQISVNASQSAAKSYVTIGLAGGLGTFAGLKVGGTSAPTSMLHVLGDTDVSGVYLVSGLQVLGTRKTGWSAPSGAVSRATFAPSTVTLSELAQRVHAIINDLTSHGIIGA